MKHLILIIVFIILLGLCVWTLFENKKKQSILTFTYDKKLSRYMIHGLWLDTTIYCGNYEYILPNDPTNFIKQNWYDRNKNSNANTLFKYEYIKHGTCFDLTSTEYMNLVKHLYEKYYDKYVKNAKTNKKEIWIYMNENYDVIKIRHK